MPHKQLNDSDSLTSQESNTSSTTDPNPDAVSRKTLRKPPVIIHNKGGQIFDETRPFDWDKQRWK